ncbi:MAG TPA: hypothetical protein ENL09_01285 [Bacteroidetes bacterium]|nr:hypothetical protein [Bacteroidota bacterium]
MKILKICTLLIAFLFVTINVNAQESTESKLAPKEKISVVTLQGTVSAIVKETREITLIGERGEMVSFVADEAIKRFDEIEVGDVIAVEYRRYMKAEFRKPTAEEIAEPLFIIEDAKRATKDEDPGGVAGGLIRAVVTIEAINRPLMIVIVQGPQGNFLTIEAEDVSLLEKLHVGQVVILTYAEVIAISLNKVSSVE